MKEKTISIRLELSEYIKLLQEVESTGKSITEIIRSSLSKKDSKSSNGPSKELKRLKNIEERYNKILSFKKVGDCNNYLRSLEGCKLPKKQPN